MASAKPYKLPHDQVAKLVEEQRSLHDLLTEFDKAEECGIDCQAYRKTLKDAQETIEALLKNYGPTQRH